MTPEQDTGIVQFMEIAGFPDRLSMLHGLLSYPMMNWVSQFFTRTRNSLAELHFVDYCRAIIEQNSNEIDSKEYERYDRALIGYELSAYDRLNWWHEYITLFESVRKEKMYLSQYGGFRDDPAFNSYVIYEEGTIKYGATHIKHVHFLYLSDRRYRHICKKQQKLMAGKGVGNLLRHQSYQLTDEDLSARYLEMEKLFEFMKSVRERGPAEWRRRTEEHRKSKWYRPPR